MSTPGCFTVNALAAHLGVSRGSIYNYLADGRLNAIKIGHRTVVTSDEVQRFIGSRPAYRPATAAPDHTLTQPRLEDRGRRLRSQHV